MEKKHEDVIEQLRNTGMELWLRAESWKDALYHIRKISDDPFVIRYIDKIFKEN